jgi:hypothetical protein
MYYPGWNAKKDQLCTRNNDPTEEATPKIQLRWKEKQNSPLQIFLE